MRKLFLVFFCAVFVWACRKQEPEIAPVEDFPHTVSFTIVDNRTDRVNDVTINQSLTDAWFQVEEGSAIGYSSDDSLELNVRIILWESANTVIGYESILLNLRGKAKKGDLESTGYPNPYYHFNEPSSYLPTIFPLGIREQNVKIEYYQNFLYAVQEDFSGSSRLELTKAELIQDEMGSFYFDLEGTFTVSLSLYQTELESFKLQNGQFQLRVNAYFY